MSNKYGKNQNTNLHKHNMSKLMNKKSRNIRLNISYDGSGYNGWQRLANNRKTVQGTLEDCLSAILDEKIQIIGSGRTDVGVHALAQVANFHTSSSLSLNEILDKLRERLPRDIWVRDIFEVNKDFHSRFDAVSKTYEYRIELGERQSVFTSKYCYFTKEKLNIKAMQLGATYLIGEHDFKAFCTDRKDGKSTVRTIYDLQVIPCVNDRFYRPIDEIRIHITGNGFLYNMVRIIVGTLLEVGEGKRKAEDIKDILQSKKRENSGVTAQSQGLYLVEVRY